MGVEFTRLDPFKENLSDWGSLLMSALYRPGMSASELERLCREEKAETERYCRQMNRDYEGRIIDSENSEVKYIIRDFYTERPSEEKITELQKEYLKLITETEIRPALDKDTDESVLRRTGFGMLKKIMKETGIEPLQKIVDEGCTVRLERDLISLEYTSEYGLEKEVYKKVSHLQNLEEAIFGLKKIRMRPSEETIQKWYGIIIGLKPDRRYISEWSSPPFEYSPIFKLDCVMKLEDMTGIKPKEEYNPQLGEFKKKYLQYLNSSASESFYNSLSFWELTFGCSRLRKRVKSFGEEGK